MSRITVHKDDDGEVEVWLDTEVADRDGICIGLGRTRTQSLVNAKYELKRRLADIQKSLTAQAVTR